MTLEQIITDCKKNKPKAQEQLYQLFSKKFYGVCLKYSSNYADAQDNLQDGFLIIFRKIDQFSGKGHFEGWAKRIMINNALQKLKGIRYLEVINDNIPEDDVEIDEIYGVASSIILFIVSLIVNACSSSLEAMILNSSYL